MGTSYQNPCPAAVTVSAFSGQHRFFQWNCTALKAVILHLFFHHSMSDTRVMPEIKQTTAALAVAAPRIRRFRGLFGALRRLWRLYLETPVGCEITARWLRGDNLRE
jgi:hypothetical protein